MTKQYFLGLDCGTNSIGWAATDEEYHLLKANGKSEWGARLFDEAETAANRRTARSNRRRAARVHSRLKLLRLLFRDEMAKVDPEFYQRLRESFYCEEDKNLQNNSRNTLFNDPNFTDQDFHRQYPTIWHLRQAIVHADTNTHFDLRLYFLAIQHIMKHRGHFLLEGSFGSNDDDFNRLYDEFVEIAERYDYVLNTAVGRKVRDLICDKTVGKLDKKKQLKELLWTDETDADSEHPADLTALAGLIIGSKVDLAKLFPDAESYSCSFDSLNFEEKASEIEETIGPENMDLIFAAKKLYDFGVLHNLLGEHQFISDAMVANYEQHKHDLTELKTIFKPYPDIYKALFATSPADATAPTYAGYIGTAFGVKGGHRQKLKAISQADFNKYLRELFVKIGYSGPLAKRAESDDLLPKQRGQAKGTIPQQIHHQELVIILEKLGQDFPSFATVDPNEESDCKTKAAKIAKMHEFRIPYYCGPLVKRKFDENGNPVKNGKSEFSWADEEIRELVYPWNFDMLVDKNTRASNFIRRMTNECTYLLGEDVLPKASLLYQKYMVLNELNNLKLDGQRIDNDLKQKIFTEGYQTGILSANVTLKRLAKWVADNFPETRGMELSGASETKFLPKLSTYHDFRKILGQDFEKDYTRTQLDKVVEAITILGEEKVMLRVKIAEILHLDKESSPVKALSKLSYKDWGRLSEKFLGGIKANIDGRELTIIDALWETNCNLMELLSNEYGYRSKIDDINQLKLPAAGKRLSFDDVSALYCSPAVKRSIWQAIKIVEEITRVNHAAPAKIFLEVTREENDARRRGYTKSRKKDLEEKLRAVHTEDAKAILAELGNMSENALQSKKLYLYTMQMGKCAYCGEPIHLDEINNTQLYDIDHIYPRSLTKDDSITRNLVLVHAAENRAKTNIYPISTSIYERMKNTWAYWYQKGMITKAKYERLIRREALTPNELGDFIARQIVETSQSVKAIRDLLQRAYPDTKVVMVKDGQVSEFRHLMGYDKKDGDGNVYQAGHPEFIKLRELNDFHHAKDAYLNVVVGNVMNGTFTDDPYGWVKQHDNQNYTIRPERLFRDQERYETEKDGIKSITSWPFVQNWHFADSIKIVSDVMKQNDVLWTRMSYIESSEISDLQLIGKGDKVDGIMQIKRTKRLDPKKYGGYNSLKGAHFTLIEYPDKKGNRERRIIPILQAAVPQNLDHASPAYLSRLEQYINKEYPGAQIIVPVIRYKSLVIINGVPLHIAGRTGDSLVFTHGLQLRLPDELNLALKRVLSIIQRDKVAKGKYQIELKDGVGENDAKRLFAKILEVLPNYSKVPGLGPLVEKISSGIAQFDALDLKGKCLAIGELLKLCSCSAEKADLSLLVSNAGYNVKCGSKLSSFDSVLLTSQSPTGLFERILDLKTAKPQARRR